jgi:lysophospholipase L1-like esterase
MLGKLALLVASSTVALLLGELALRLVVNPGDFLFATMVEHPVLGHRIRPGTTGHDALGFRNPAVPERARVVAIGDSFTYGFGAARDDSWPQQLGRLLNEPVYNMALGGYGPLEYLYLAQHEASRLKPQLLIVAFYSGNDLIDAYHALQRKAYWQSWRAPGTPDPGDSAYERAWNSEPPKRFGALRDWLSRNSVLYSMLRVTILQRFGAWERDRMALQAGPERQMIWRDRAGDAVRTIFTPELRLSAVDPELPSVQQGLQVAKRAFGELDKTARQQGADLLVLLIPTKERAYCGYLRESGDALPRTFERLCDAEQRVTEDLAQFLTANAIRHLDMTRPLDAQVRKHVALFPPDSDAHPQAAGYGVIARALYEALRAPPRP